MASELDGTVKEMLRLMEKNADERHQRVSEAIGEMKDDIAELQGKVTTLQTSEAERTAVSAFGGKMRVAAIAILGVLVNIPAGLYYLHGGVG